MTHPSYKEIEAALERLPGYVKEILAGDRQHYEHFYKNLLMIMHHYAQAIIRKKAGNKVDVHDLVQEGLLKIMRVLQDDPQRLAAVESWPKWLYVLLRRTAFDELRRVQRAKTISLHTPVGQEKDEGLTLEDLLASQEPGTEEYASSNEALQEIIAYLQNQPKEKGEVFRLYLQGMTQKAIADHKGLPQATVNNWIYRIKQALIEF